MNNIEIIEDLKKDLPETVAGIGYGSGFYRQKGYGEEEKPDKDIIFIVDNLYRFLVEDYHMHPDHFYGGAAKKYKKIKDKKRLFYYNRLGCLKFCSGNYKFKLMVIEKNALLYDILTWRYYGMAARLSKPIVYGDIPKDIEDAIAYNREASIITALLSLPDDEVSKEDLYKTISGLSYIAEWRMLLHSEKKTKAGDIVEGAFDKFEDMYGDNHLLCYNGEMIKNDHPLELIDSLPENLKKYILRKIDVDRIDVSNREDLEQLSNVIKNYFKHINLVNTPLVMYSSAKTLGPAKTIKHALSKHKNAKGW